LNISATLRNSGTTGTELRISGSATAFGYTVGSINQTLSTDLQFWKYFGDCTCNCVEFDLAPVRARACDTPWP
jgi:hypothetical protein